MSKHEWEKNASCSGQDKDLFFDKYEEDVSLRLKVDSLCSQCPVVRHCFAVGISQKEYGVWGGVYLENGKISREFNRHRSKEDWAEKWKNLVTDVD
jgi:hypothetical protein